MVDAEMLALLWQTASGSEFIIRSAGIAVILGGLCAPRLGLQIAAAGGVLTLISFTKIGHVAELESFWFDLLMLVHLLGVSFWVGILLPLKAITDNRENLTWAADLGFKFGQAATCIVPVLIGAGGLVAWNLLGGLPALFTTSYGITLLAKICLVSLLLTVAAVNKMRLVPELRKGSVHALNRLRQSVTAEWVLSGAIMFATAWLTTVMNPPMSS